MGGRASVSGSDIVDGFRNARYATIGAAAMGWFDPKTPVSKKLTGSFEQFLFTGDKGLAAQLAFIEKQAARETRRDLFVFLNVGETHVPYHFEGAPWDRADNPCLPFQKVDRSAECRERQRLCCEYVDRKLAPCWNASLARPSSCAATMAIAGARTGCGSTASPIP